MTLYVVWYYWYKNIWDELLLFWLLSYYSQLYSPDQILIKSWNKEWLELRVSKHTTLIKNLKITADITVVTSIPFFPSKNNNLVIWGGEVITDARTFPYNGWNHFARYFPYFLYKKVSIAWGIWTIKKIWTRILYTLLFSNSRHVVVREKDSFKIVKSFFDSVVLHRDFALDVLDTLEVVSKWYQESYCIINLNRHIRDDQVKKSIISKYNYHQSQGDLVYYIPWAMWDDDDDLDIYYELQKTCSELKLYDWTTKDLQEICWFISWASKWYVTRLHLVILCTYFNIPIDTIIYQEKVNRFLSA